MEESVADQEKTFEEIANSSSKWAIGVCIILLGQTIWAIAPSIMQVVKLAAKSDVARELVIQNFSLPITIYLDLALLTVCIVGFKLKSRVTSTIIFAYYSIFTLYMTYLSIMGSGKLTQLVFNYVFIYLFFTAMVNIYKFRRSLTLTNA